MYLSRTLLLSLQLLLGESNADNGPVPRYLCKTFSRAVAQQGSAKKILQENEKQQRKQVGQLQENIDSSTGEANEDEEDEKEEPLPLISKKQKLSQQNSV